MLCTWNFRFQLLVASVQCSSRRARQDGSGQAASAPKVRLLSRFGYTVEVDAFSEEEDEDVSASWLTIMEN